MQSFQDIVMGRRTCKVFNGRPVKTEDLERLLEWAVRAPNHRLNQPWRFRILSAEIVEKWLNRVEKLTPPDELTMLQPTVDKARKIGALIYVGVKKDPNPTIDRENYAAACAAVENILLGASSLGLESFWSTNRLMNTRATTDFMELDDDEEFVAGIWLGYGEKPSLKARHPLNEVARWLR